MRVVQVTVPCFIVGVQEKFKLGLDFPNLPYLKAGDVKLTQSLAILRFLARRHGLFPETEENLQRVDLAEQQVSR